MSEIEHSIFMQACRGEQTARTPVWFMRQAGRFSPEHRELYDKHGVRGITTTPELNARVTTLPVKKYNVDAAVLYADILLPLEDMGMTFDYGKGDTGPVFEEPLQNKKDVENLRRLDPERGVPYIPDTIRLVKERLPGNVPLIGFSGGPFTLASYMIEGKASRKFRTTQGFLASNPETARKLLRKLTDSIILYLDAQVKAGIDTVMLFESWVGTLSPLNYRRFVHPELVRIIEHFDAKDLPTLFFGTQTGGLFPFLGELPVNVIGLDWRTRLRDAKRWLGGEKTVMGNLDPSTLLGPEEIMREETREILSDAETFPAHIFNLGHRVPARVEPSRLRELVDFVHEESSPIEKH